MHQTKSWTICCVISLQLNFYLVSLITTGVEITFLGRDYGPDITKTIASHLWSMQFKGTPAQMCFKKAFKLG